MTLAGRRVLLGVTGGIAAYKVPHLARSLVGEGAEVTVVMTGSAARFVGPDTFAALTGRPVHTSLWDAAGDVIHVRLAHEADIVVIAPATANLIAKAALGLADDLLTSTLLEYRGPIVLAPAMHTGMWEHEATRANVETLRARGVVVVGPETGALAHGDVGVGRMVEPDAIAEAVRSAIGADGDLTGRVVVVSAGPTQEAIDPVRFLGNRSTGKMGVAVAAEAQRRGADVRLVLGPDTVPPPAGVRVDRVTSAEEMRTALRRQVGEADAVVMAAAVADFRPKAVSPGKLKKDEGAPELVLEPTPDILRELGEDRRRGLVLVGFAAETDDVESAGRRKLASKRVDIVVANEVGAEGTGFGSDTNRAAILDADGDDIALRDWTKPELASAILDRVVGRLG